MNTSLLTFSQDTEINYALNMLLKNHYSGAPVINKHGILVGVLSQKDCLKAVLNAFYHQDWGGTVQDYMTCSVEALEPDMELTEVANRFINSTYRRFPVLEHGKLVGQISRRDVLVCLNQQWR